MKFEPRGDKLDKYRRWILDGKDPADIEARHPEEARLWARMRRAWSLASMGYGRNQIVATLRNDDNDQVGESQAYAAVRDSMKLYGSMGDVDREGMRLASYENYKLLAQLARKDGNHGAAIKAQELADRLFHLFDRDEVVIDPKKYELPAMIEYTTDPKQLLLQQGNRDAERAPEPETLDADFTEVDDDAEAE